MNIERSPQEPLPSFPQVQVKSADSRHQVKGRGLFASQAFEPGQLILSEYPVLHTSHPIAQSLLQVRHAADLEELEIPLDWQRLLYLYAHFRLNFLYIDVLDSLKDLSVEGVCSELAREADPEREEEYGTWAEEWVAWYNKQIGAPGRITDSNSWEPTPEEIFRLLAVLETNSHSRDEDDMLDLQDPRLDSPLQPKAASTEMSLAQDWTEEGDSDLKDEACGLWLVASMLNHSCIPNCTVYIPLTRTTDADSSPVLHLRCIRPVSPGEELVISYHDEEFLPKADRQDLLRARGFECLCPLCRGEVREYMRSSVCPNPNSQAGDGVCCPIKVGGEMRWVCDRCGGTLSDYQVAEVEHKEEEWMGQWEQILAMISSENSMTDSTQLLAYKLLQHLSTTPTPSFTRHDQALRTVSTPYLAPLHTTHSHVYSFLKYALFEQSVWLRQHFGDEGVSGVLLCMLGIVERSLGSVGDDGLSVKVSEERRVLGYWLVKEAERRLTAGVVDRGKWENIAKNGMGRWEVGMMYLCGHT